DDDLRFIRKPCHCRDPQLMLALDNRAVRQRHWCLFATYPKGRATRPEKVVTPGNTKASFMGEPTSRFRLLSRCGARVEWASHRVPYSGSRGWRAWRQQRSREFGCGWFADQTQSRSRIQSIPQVKDGCHVTIRTQDRRYLRWKKPRQRGEWSEGG